MPSLSSLIYMITGSFSALFIFLGTTILLAKWMSPEDLGILMAAEAFTTLFSFFFDFGFKNSILKCSSENRLESAIGNAILIKLAIVIPVIALTYLTAWLSHFEPRMIEVIHYYTLAMILDSFAKIFGIVRRALGQFKMTAAMNVTNRVLRLVVIFIVLVLCKGSMLFLVQMFAVSSLIKLILATVTTLRLTGISVDLSSIKEMFKDSFAYSIYDVLEEAQGNIDRLMLTYLMGTTSVAFYSVPARLNRFSQLIIQTVNRVYLPSLHDLYVKVEKAPSLALISPNSEHISVSGLADDNILHSATNSEVDQALKDFLDKVSFYSSLTGVLIFLGIYFTAEPILYWIFGETYAESIPLVKWFGLLTLIWFLSICPSMLMACESFHKRRIAIVLCSTLLNIGLGWYLIPKMGLIAAIHATNIANFVALIAMLYFTRHRIDVRMILLFCAVGGLVFV
jgi:O-antigen/teichoic acid export membrane protein